MDSQYEPLVTTMDSFVEIETKFFEDLTNHGVPQGQAELIAKAVTQFFLGYLTIDGATASMINNGVDAELATMICNSLAKVLDESNPGSRSVAPVNPAHCEPASAGQL